MGDFVVVPIPNRDGLVVVCSVEDRGAGYSPESQHPRGIFGFPDEFITTIRYVDVYTLTSASNGIAKQYMRMNSLFDPDQTGTGHQPYYFDQFAALYNRYTVLGSKANCRVQFAAQCDCYSSAVRPSCYWSYRR